jgi:hypothetical protein
MNRRTYLMTMAVAGGVSTAAAQPARNAIQLHVDLDVNPAQENEMVSNFRKVFRPTISKQAGFVAVTLLKLRNVMAGDFAKNWNYRLIISFQTEEQRLTWVKTDDHQRVWPTIEKTLRGSKIRVILYDVV